MNLGDTVRNLAELAKSAPLVNFPPTLARIRALHVRQAFTAPIEQVAAYHALLAPCLVLVQEKMPRARCAKKAHTLRARLPQPAAHAPLACIAAREPPSA